MSSYIYDPHRTRQKPNRYYQRKGQIIRAKYLDTQNPAISKEDASRYVAAVKTYFPEQFTCPSSNLNNTLLNKVKLSEIKNNSYIISNVEIQNIDGDISQKSKAPFLMITTNKNPPNLLTPNDVTSYSWMCGNSNQINQLYPVELWYRVDGILGNIDVSKAFFINNYVNGNWIKSAIVINSTYNLFLYEYDYKNLKLSTKKIFNYLHLD